MQLEKCKLNELLINWFELKSFFIKKVLVEMTTTPRYSFVHRLLNKYLPKIHFFHFQKFSTYLFSHTWNSSWNYRSSRSTPLDEFLIFHLLPRQARKSMFSTFSKSYHLINHLIRDGLFKDSVKMVYVMNNTSFLLFFVGHSHTSGYYRFQNKIINIKNKRLFNPFRNTFQNHGINWYTLITQLI